MLTILFWNFPCKQRFADLLPGLARTARHHDVDILVLAESRKGADPEEVREALNHGSSTTYDLAESPPAPRPDILFFTKFDGRELRPFRANNRVDIRRLNWSGCREILLAATHFYDRRNFSIDEQAAKVPALNSTVREAEFDRKHNRTVLFGDLNMNPYETGMINFESGLGAMATRELAQRHGSTGHLDPQRFYNPSWARMGRQSERASGTYYFKSVSKPTNIFWHHLDQVLIRPSLLDAFNDDDFAILTSIPGPNPGSSINLMRSTDKHWKIEYSDHLPILFKLDLSRSLDDVR